MITSFLCPTWKRFVAKLCDCELKHLSYFDNFSRPTQLLAAHWCNENVRGFFCLYFNFHIYV